MSVPFVVVVCVLACLCSFLVCECISLTREVWDLTRLLKLERDLHELELEAMRASGLTRLRLVARAGRRVRR